MIIFASIIVTVCTLVVIMAIKARANGKKELRLAIDHLIETQQRSRLRKWNEKGLVWKAEQKKPVKVKFD